MNEIGNKIRTLRKAKGYKQIDICNNILSRTELSKIENGRRTPSIYQIKYISEILNTSVDYLLNVNYEKSSDKIKSSQKSSIEYLFNSKQYNKITISFEKGNIFSTNDIKNLFFVGSSYYKTEFYTESKKLLLKFIKKYEAISYKSQEKYCEKYAEALRDLFYIENGGKEENIELSKLHKAKKELERHEKFNCKLYYEILYHIGFVYFCINKYDNAEAIISELLDKNKEIINLTIVPDSHLVLSRVYYNTDKYDKSIENLNKALFLYKYSKNDNVIVCNVEYSNIYRFMGEYNKAISIIEDVSERYLEEKKIDKIFKLYKSFIYFNMIEYESVSVILKCIRINDLKCPIKKSSYYFLRGHIAYMNNKYKEAERYLKKSEKYFILNHFYYDLKLLYSDLYNITRDDKYKSLYEKYSIQHKNSKKNIVESLDIKKYIKKPANG